jgi:hypothetical protein
MPNSTPSPNSHLRPRLFPKGTPVLANGHFYGSVDGMDVRGNYIVLFNDPVCFPTLKVKIERAAFAPALVREIRVDEDLPISVMVEECE